VCLPLQLIATAAVLGWVPGNYTKLAVMAVIWTIGFRRLTRHEAVLMLAVNALFAIMNLGALRNGVFRFLHPDLAGMPIYEYAMWGFYTLHTIRFVDGTVPRGRIGLVLLMAAIFTIPFVSVADRASLTVWSGVTLLACLAVFHEKQDFAYVGYMVLIGALIEYVGVWTGQWSYPGDPFGRVPAWFVTMWGGVGLFTRRLGLAFVVTPSRTGTSSH
jgi:hypothetical protein